MLRNYSNEAYTIFTERVRTKHRHNPLNIWVQVEVEMKMLNNSRPIKIAQNLNGKYTIRLFNLTAI